MMTVASVQELTSDPEFIVSIVYLSGFCVCAWRASSCQQTINMLTDEWVAAIVSIVTEGDAQQSAANQTAASPVKVSDSKQGRV